LSALFGAVDLGASSGRVIAGTLEDSKISLHEIHRFKNSPIPEGERLVWDFAQIFGEIVQGLEKLAVFASSRSMVVESIGIDCWAVDYGLVAKGKLLQNPGCYRDPRNELGVSAVHAKVSFEELYLSTGLQFLPFNSIYQLASQQVVDPRILDSAEHVLMMPDLIGYFLSGEMATERTNASSTGLLSAKKLDWDDQIAQKLDLRLSLFAPLANPGEVLGQVLPEVVHSLAGTNVVLVGSHDTASAVVGVPATSRDCAYLSSGTWSLLGAELDSPVLSEASRQANFTNELGVDNRVRYLKNLSGLWLVSESLRYFESEGEPAELTELLEQASLLNPTARFDVSDPRFISPGDMPIKIQLALAESGQRSFSSKAELIAIILHSLAQSYAENFETLKTLTGMSFSKLHIIGGGSQNSLLNQLTANYTNSEVVAGPVEATAIGNILVQARSAGLLQGNLEQLRQVIQNSNIELQKYFPQP